jgi:hypothetical protein
MPPKFWTATIFLHAHLQVVYYNCVKFHKTPISHLGGVALTRYTTSLLGEIIQLIFSRKEGGGGMYLVSATLTKLLIEFL